MQTESENASKLIPRIAKNTPDIIKKDNIRNSVDINTITGDSERHVIIEFPRPPEKGTPAYQEEKDAREAAKASIKSLVRNDDRYEILGFGKFESSDSRKQLFAIRVYGA